MLQSLIRSFVVVYTSHFLCDWEVGLAVVFTDTSVTVQFREKPCALSLCCSTDFLPKKQELLSYHQSMELGVGMYIRLFRIVAVPWAF